jgi:hypothetical protein
LFEKKLEGGILVRDKLTETVSGAFMRKSILALFLSLSLLAVSSAFISPIPTVTDNEISLHFPETATFRATLTDEVDITSVVLEYGNEQQTCGQVIAKAFPQITQGKTVHAEWTWEMRQSGSLPPGAQLWWRWRVTDANGNETLTEKKTATWLDDAHHWQSMSIGDTQSVHLHWYEGDQTFAADLAHAAVSGLQFNETQSGLKADAPIDIYVYGSTDDLKEAILYEPSWTGGQAFPEQDIVIIGIAPSDLEWGRDAIVHELTHVLVGHLTFSCLGDVPTWLNEGLAVYSEGELDAASREQLDDAIKDDSLLTIRSLSSGFSEVSDKAYLSYSESYSITKFLVETYGQDKMTALLTGLRDGLTIDEALQQIYGFSMDGLEEAWRGAIGAPSRPVSPESTVQPTPTLVPTIIPVSGAALSVQSTASTVPTSSFTTPTAGTPVQNRPPLSLTLILLGLCCFFVLFFGMFVLGFIVRRQNIKEQKNGQ